MVRLHDTTLGNFQLFFQMLMRMKPQLLDAMHE